MIKKIKARYECHADTELELAPGITGLLGDNDNGKSSISRAVRWVVDNSPRGDEMIPWTGKKEAKVSIETDGRAVTRRKGPSNEYQVDGEKFKAVSAAVPEEVTQALNIDTTNIQAQVDQFFLLQASPGAVAKRINEVAGISDSDRAIKRTNELISDSNRRIKDLTEEQQQCQKYLTEHTEVIEEARALLKWVEELDQFITLNTEQVAKAQRLSDEIKSQRTIINLYPDCETVGRLIGELYEHERWVGRKTDFCRTAHDLSLQLHFVDCTRFEFLEGIDLGRMAEVQEGIGRDEASLTRARGLSVGIHGVDMSRFSGLEEMERSVEEYRIEVDELKEWSKGLFRARVLATELHTIDPGKWAVLEETNLSQIQSVFDLVMTMERRLGILQQASFQVYQAEEAEDQFNQLLAQATDAGVVCRECGQILRGDDTCSQ